MPTPHSTSDIAVKAGRVAATLVALGLAMSMTGFTGGTAYASSERSGSVDRGRSSAPGQDNKAEPSPQPSRAPYANQGGVTTGSNTTKYETAADQNGSTFSGTGGGQPSGDVHRPQPYSRADKNNTGANDTSVSNPYRSTRDGSPSLNGNGGGRQVGQPCAGCVGRADNKNPKGQGPNGTDHNAGYECDRNHGIGRGNPAHTGCAGGSTGGGSTGGGSTGGGSTGGGSMLGNTNDQITICHATGSASNPFVVISPSKNGVIQGHVGHRNGADIIPAFSYTDNGVTKYFPGQNWAAGNQAQFDNACTTPPAPPTCPNGQPMPAPGVCGAGGAPPQLCPHGSVMPVSGNIADCNPPVLCPIGTTMAPGAGTCNPPVVCPQGAMVGPLVPGTTRAGCQVSGDSGGAAVGPPTSEQPGGVITNVGNQGGVISNSGNPQPLRGGGLAPTVEAARPTALPFTGTDAGLLAAGAAMMLLVGSGLVLTTRRRALVAA